MSEQPTLTIQLQAKLDAKSKKNKNKKKAKQAGAGNVLSGAAAADAKQKPLIGKALPVLTLPF